METSREAKTLPRTYKPKERSLGFLIYGDTDGEAEGKGKAFGGVVSKWTGNKSRRQGESFRLSSGKGKSAKFEVKGKLSVE